MKNHKIYIIVAVDKNFGIGKDKTLPWHFKKEIEYFRDTTVKTKDPKKRNMVIMGRTTWDSIDEKYRPLKNRENIVLTRNPDYKTKGAKVLHSIDEAIKSAGDDIETIFIIGGESIFKEGLQNENVDGIYLTKIENEYECDAFLPKIPERFSKVTKIGEAEENEIFREYFLYEK